MGIGYNSAVLLGKAKRNQVCFDKVLTIGHQNLCLLPRQIEMLSQRHDVDLSAADYPYGVYADEFLEKFLGAQTVMSLDCSDFEQCDIVHDMNRPIESSLHQTFDVVIDGGSLEHIFNFPVAVANCMNLVKEGGSLFVFTPANNHMGHGFYQFSPELFFRIFDGKYGFQIHDVLLESRPYPSEELSHRSWCYSVTDPVKVQNRVTLVSRRPAQMLVHAVKTKHVNLFQDYPIQSDYAAAHADFAMAGQRTDVGGGHAAGHQLSLRAARRLVRNLLPLPIRNSIIGTRQLRQHSLGNKSFYGPWTP
ncbi:hypothetical protein [Mycobacterium sp. 1274761.0]|uniref:hypothetical protein n=1 Tax=Mycobacterium sp. 1274761.0 TaxID=1834077 RepID=UPI0008025268|nr:hypothetical protein [Mycobacterium sp. 1274761.0]OBK74418.1 hypothetical protein A5651_09910 [Mycobacterium sp. 1274761.0]